MAIDPAMFNIDTLAAMTGIIVIGIAIPPARTVIDIYHASPARAPMPIWLIPPFDFPAIAAAVAIVKTPEVEININPFGILMARAIGLRFLRHKKNAHYCHHSECQD